MAKKETKKQQSARVKVQRAAGKKEAQRIADVAGKKANEKRVAAKKAAAKKAAAKSSASKSAAAKRAANKKSADAKRAANAAKVAARKETAGKDKGREDKGDKGTASKTAKGKNFFGTNIPLSAVADAGKRNEINARLKTDIAAGDWEGANDALFSAAFNTVKGGKGQGNPNVGKVHSGEWKVNKSPLSWAETAINSSNDFYPQKDGSVVTFDDKLGSLKDGVSSGTWGGQGTGENNQRSGQAPPKAGVKGAAPINVDASGKQSALRQRGLRDLNTIFGAGTTDGRVRTTGGTGGIDVYGRGGFAGGGLLGDQYGGRVGEYQVPNRSFNWQTDPTEQALMASAMGRPDLAQMMLTGQYGPLKGQDYQYGGGQTRINYGPGGGYGGGAGAGAGVGLGGTGGRLGPLGDTGAGAAGAGAGTVLPGEHAGWTPPGGFEVDPIKVAAGQGPFMQWTIAQHAKNQAANQQPYSGPSLDALAGAASVPPRVGALGGAYQQDAPGMDAYSPRVWPNTPPPGSVAPWMGSPEQFGNQEGLPLTRLPTTPTEVQVPMGSGYTPPKVWPSTPPPGQGTAAALSMNDLSRMQYQNAAARQAAAASVGNPFINPSIPATTANVNYPGSYNPATGRGGF